MFTVDYKRLINGLVLTSVVTLHRQTDSSAKRTDFGATRQIKLIIHSLNTHNHEYNEKFGHFDGPPGCRP